jgi:EAL domain-containing protein (putative c-di-GMP-specific phosphodiesterase class I)
MRALADLGIGIVVDEFGRGSTSLPRLARLPVRGLLLDRRLALSAGVDPVSRRVATAAVALARAFNFVPMAAGVDDESQRRLLISLGCEEGLGDAFSSRFAASRNAPGTQGALNRR